MPLRYLELHHFRCITHAVLQLHPQRNFIYGPNGAGKTSLLEAAHVVSRGRSFRVRDNRRLIQRGESEFWVRAKVAASDVDQNIGARYSRGALDLRVDGQAGRKASDLSRSLPLQVIDPSVHKLIEGPPNDRRRFLDWGVFHVEHGYLAAWSGYRRVLAQRNAALKAMASDNELVTWTDALLEAGETVHAARARFVANLGTHFSKVGERLAQTKSSISYRSGGFDEKSYADALTASLDLDRQRGVTHVGPHRADLNIRFGDLRAADTASRGQQKMLAAALVIAQIRTLGEADSAPTTLLVDDPTAELDPDSLSRFRDEIDGLEVQTIFTAISPDHLPLAKSCHEFHMEQGAIRAVEHV